MSVLEAYVEGKTKKQKEGEGQKRFCHPWRETLLVKGQTAQEFRGHKGTAQTGRALLLPGGCAPNGHLRLRHLDT